MDNAALPHPGIAPDAVAAVDESTEKNAVFNFEHKVFALAGARFALDSSGQPLFHVQLGSLDAAVTLTSLRSEFGIVPASHDCQLITRASQGLRYVKEIRPGESIPRELLDGTASWSVEDKHRLAARAKLLVQVLAWLKPGAGTTSALQDLLSAEDPTTREEVQTAIAELAEGLGLGRDRKQEVLDRIDACGRELAYIEALVDKAAGLHMIRDKATQLSHAYRREPAVFEELMRIGSLIKRPIAEFQKIFTQFEAQTGEILGLLKNIKGQVSYIRETRDELHTRLMPWMELIDLWRVQPVERGRSAEGIIRALYRLLATHHASGKAWR